MVADSIVSDRKQILSVQSGTQPHHAYLGARLQRVYAATAMMTCAQVSCAPRMMALQATSAQRPVLCARRDAGQSVNLCAPANTRPILLEIQLTCLSAI